MSEALSRARRAGALTSSEYELFRTVIGRHFGLDYPPSRRQALAARLERRMSAHGLRTFSDYYRLLRYGNGEEWRFLAEVVTNNETYFFRESAQFDELIGLLPTLAERRAPLRVLSAGCSSGEEAFSLAAVLAAHAELLPHGFEVCGVDISARCVAEARSGRYSDRSFRLDRPKPTGVERFFSRSEGTWSVKPGLRARVRFHIGNLVDPGGLRLGEFDVIFCRNVLIYVRDDDIRRFLRTLALSLRPRGYLFLGQSESLLGRVTPFAAVRLGSQFAYVLRDDGTHPRGR